MKSVRGSASSLGATPSDPNSETLLSLDSLLRAVRRQRGVVALCTGLGLVLGLVIALISPRLYIASASLIIDPPGIVSQTGAVASRGLDTGAVDSQVEVLRSDRIAIAVAEALDLGNDPRFMDQPKSLMDRLRGLLPASEPEDLSPEEEARLLLADIVAELDDNVWIDRVGESYVLEIDYTSRFPVLSAEIANAYTEAYLQDQIGSRLEAARHAGDWLETQLADIKQRAFDADLAAQMFRAESPPAAPPGGTDDRGAPDDANRPRQDAARRVVQLHQLEREAETYRNLYQALLGRYQDSIQQQSFPVASGRVISPAMPPPRPSLPRKSLVLALALMAGGGAGVAIGALRELRDRSFRVGAQIREDLGLRYLGALPRVGPAKSGGQAAAPTPGAALVRPAAMRHVLDAPLSPFADALRGTLAAVEAWRGDRTPCIIGLLSALPGEGRSTVAANLALLAATSGSRTLLVDGDLRSPGLSRAIASEAGLGLVEAADEPARFDCARLTDPETGLAFVPAGPAALAGGRVLSPAALQALRGLAGTRYDYVFVDLPPAGRFSDARAVGCCLDGLLLVVLWGRTPRALVGGMLADDAELRRKTIGGLLNAVETDRIRLYADRTSADFYRMTV